MPNAEKAPSRRIVALATVLLAAFVLQAGIAARRDSVTIDEFIHLPVGLQMLRSGDFGLDPINPPLARCLAAVPLLALSLASFAREPGEDGWDLAQSYMARNSRLYLRSFVWARAVAIALAAALGGLVFWWAARLYGYDAGLVALGLFAFSPEMLAHGHLVTPDLPGALGFTGALFATWRLLERPGPSRAAALGVALGFATLLKLSAGALPAVVGIVVTWSAVRERSSAHEARPGGARWLGLLALAAALALLVLNAGYAFQGSFAPLRSATLAPDGALATLRDAVPWLRLPVPLPLLDGLDRILTLGQSRDPSYFLNGELSAEGWWYYHLAAFGYKTPIPILLASLLALGLWAAGRSRGARDYCLFVPVLVLFAANSLFNSLYIGVRHVLPVYPLLFIAIAPWLLRAAEPLRRGVRSARALALAALVGLGSLWFVAGNLAIAPRYLQYMNEIGGGAEGGHEHLIDSNLDWGQDLVRLGEYLRERGSAPVHLAYFGRVDPGLYGIAFRPLEGPDAHGTVVASASFVMGRPYFWYQQGRLQWLPPHTFSWLRGREPVARVGALFVYELP